MTNPFGPATPVAAPPASGNPFAAPAYAPPAAQQAPAPATAPMLGTFAPAAPVVAGGGGGAKLADMYGRLVLILPLRIERNRPSNFKDPKTQLPKMEDRMTATVVVLDGANPIAFGGNPYIVPQIPHTKSEPLPHVSQGLWISQSKLVEQCEDALATVAVSGPGSGMVLGRLLKNGVEANSAWILGEYTEAEAATAQYYLDGVKSGQFPNPLA